MVKYLPGVLEAALGIFGIMGGPVLGAFVLGMFFPYCNEVGAFIGAFTSLIFTCWMGFGQTVARQAQTYDGSRWGRKFPTSIDNCPPSWTNFTTPEPKEPFAPFLHLELYEVSATCSSIIYHITIYNPKVSYMYFSAVACLWCVIVGAIISLIRPVDHKTLDPRLTSPALPHMFVILIVIVIRPLCLIC